MSRIVWTPVPNGYREGKLRISVLVSPKLSGSSTLDGYPAWLAWPSARPSFSVAFQGGATAPATVVSPPPRTDLWQRLFTATTPVTPKALALAAPTVPPIRSWPSRSARQMARAEHVTTMAYHPTAPPTVNAHFPSEPGLRRFDNTEPVTGIHLSDHDRKNLTGLISQRLAADGYFLGGESLSYYSAAQVDFFLAEQFHVRRSSDNPGSGRSLSTAQANVIRTAEDLDFHAALGSIAQYPPLQRALGLVIDLELDPAATGLPIPSETVLSLEVGLTTTEPYEPVYPAVAATLSKTAFRAAPSGTTTKDGLLALGSEQFGVIEVDADAGAGGLSTFSDAVHVRRTDGGGVGVAAAQPGGVTDSGAEAAPLPANRNSGFSIAHFGRAKDLAEKLRKTTARMADLSALAEAPHHAEDLTAGLRVDVFDVQAGRWYSLCRRRGTYDCAGLPFVPDEDEGLVALGHTEQDGDPTMYLHESLFTWNGYSLVTNRPGSTEEQVNGELKQVGPDSDPTGPVKLKASFRAVGLPKLRYGRTYRFRARTVDVAGNGLGRDEPPAGDFGAATPPVRYLRFEPVAAPLLLPTAPREGDEAVDVMVIQGNYDKPAQGERQRHLVPGAMTQLTAEQHGLFDVQPSPLNPGGMNKSAYEEIARRDRARLDDFGKPDPDGWGETHYFDGDTIEVPYLPDLFARGIALHGLPGLGKDEVYPVDLGSRAWPRRQGFRIRLVHGTGRPEWNFVRRTLTVRLPPGKTAEVAYSHRIDAADLDLMGVWDWFLRSGLEPGDGRTIDDLRRLATEGRLWQLTPPSTRPLTLVHAVRQPMVPPTFAKPVAVRKPGETTARIVDVLRCDPDSTAQVDVLATWTEPVDVPAEAGPKPVTGNATVAHLPVRRAAGTDQVNLGDVQEFHDTKYRRITYSAEATSRYVPFFTRTPRVKLSGTTPVVLAPGGFALSTVSVEDPLGERQYRRDLTDVNGGAGDYLLDGAAGTITRSPESSIPDGSEVDVSFVAGSVTRSNIEAQEPVVVDVRSSARPAMPDIAYLIPTFGWERADQPAGVSSTRRGNGLRVYLRRPWYSSGDGEMLGVVLFDGNGTLPSNLARYVTLRGQDPLFASSPTNRTPEIREFPLAVGAKAGYRLAESDVLPELTATVAIAPHRVEYDATRRMWFCDITMGQDKAYSPFLRLALARFQPMSLAGVEASPVVLAQFAQLNPDRTLSVVFDAAGAKAGVTVTGTGYAADSTRAAKVKVLAQVSAGPKPPVDATGWRTTAETELSGTAGQWSGELQLPAPRGSQPMRLVVEEREFGGSRLVYADAVEI